MVCTANTAAPTTVIDMQGNVDLTTCRDVTVAIDPIRFTAFDAADPQAAVGRGVSGSAGCAACSTVLWGSYVGLAPIIGCPRPWTVTILEAVDTRWDALTIVARLRRCVMGRAFSTTASTMIRGAVQVDLAPISDLAVAIAPVLRTCRNLTGVLTARRHARPLVHVRSRAYISTGSTVLRGRDVRLAIGWIGIAICLSRRAHVDFAYAGRTRWLRPCTDGAFLATFATIVDVPQIGFTAIVRIVVAICKQLLALHDRALAVET